MASPAPQMTKNTMLAPFEDAMEQKFGAHPLQHHRGSQSIVKVFRECDEERRIHRCENGHLRREAVRRAARPWMQMTGVPSPAISIAIPATTFAVRRRAP